MMRAYRSPNIPFNREAATKPGNANSERIDLGFFMLLAYPKNGSHFITDDGLNILIFTMSYTALQSELTHTFPRRPNKNSSAATTTFFS